MLDQAISFAARAHAGQLRKDGKTPYIAHPVRVMTILCHQFRVNDERILTAAILHDLIEDTTRDYESITRNFGNEVADLVVAMSKDPRLPEQKREEEYHQQIARAGWQARLIKLADCLDNVQDAIDNSMQCRACDKARWALELIEEDDPQEVQEAARILRETLKSLRSS
ncbi:HD domain-containing protein [Rubinisphaera italica]|uniref:Bifunctional (P)ppGpp synthase/hydrolase SpoT n=1 Tax=Rubinisphaera italica TaxID=2527969 RepID=A0A5C5XMT2_9PLAN|nr:HD domain-containing protein [Rubinisphaera italica]TWT63673.1 Bifunctional (p)ppGpp synthase/hydrolase SpoT [Rubinisphaera italica]HBN74961.1 hypothetical protein [Planctomycetaceae bacterium]